MKYKNITIIVVIFTIVIVSSYIIINIYSKNPDPNFHEVTITTNQSVYHGWEVLSVIIKNTGNVPVQLTSGNGNLQLKNLDEDRVVGWHTIATMNIWDLQPGQEYKVEGPLEEWKDRNMVPLQKGKYEFTMRYTINYDGESTTYHPKTSFEII
jgi:hypothetical protein